MSSSGGLSPLDPGSLKAEVERLKSRLRKAKHHHGGEVHVEEDGESNWLVAYADLMTLLFGFFVILSAYSTPNAGKIEQLKKRTSEALGGKYVKPYADLSAGLAKTLKEINLENEVTIVETDEGVTLTSRGALFFDSGSAELKPLARELMEKISDVIAKEAKGFRIVVEGHTDHTPMYSRAFPSNWELSSSRASTVVRLIESKGIPSKDLRPMGLADTEPVVPNIDDRGVAIPENQAKNRRIVVKILKQFPKRL